MSRHVQINCSTEGTTMNLTQTEKSGWHLTCQGTHPATAVWLPDTHDSGPAMFAVSHLLVAKGCTTLAAAVHQGTNA